jgi:hypothetical protein
MRPRIGRDIGSTALRSARIGVAPSIAAASMSSSGMEMEESLEQEDAERVRHRRQPDRLGRADQVQVR